MAFPSIENHFGKVWIYLTTNDVNLPIKCELLEMLIEIKEK